MDDAAHMIRMPEVITVLEAEVESRKFPSIQIAEGENGIHIFGPYRVGDIPFSQPPAGNIGWPRLIDQSRSTRRQRASERLSRSECEPFG